MSIREPSTDVPAASDELEEERHLETNKEIARQVIDRIFVRGEDAAIDELIATDFQPYTFGPMPPGRDGLRAGMRRAHEGVSDPALTIHDMIAESDRVAVRLTTSARHTGTFMGMAPPAGATRSTRSTSSGSATARWSIIGTPSTGPTCCASSRTMAQVMESRRPAGTCVPAATAAAARTATNGTSSRPRARGRRPALADRRHHRHDAEHDQRRA